MKILLMGYIGNHNLGDDLMMRAFVGRLYEMCPDAEITLLLRFCGVDEEVGELLGMLKLRNKTLHVRSVHNLRLAAVKTYIYGNFIAPKYDLCLWVGGTIFNDTSGKGLYDYFSYNIKKKIPFGYIDIGIDNIDKKERILHARELFGHSAITILRDKESCDIAMKLRGKNHTPAGDFYSDIMQTDDLVYLALEEREETQKKNVLLISWRNLSEYLTEDEEKRAQEDVAKFAKIWLDEKGEDACVELLPIDTFTDTEANERLKEVLVKEGISNVLLEKSPDPDVKIEHIATADTYISGRLHSTMFGEYYGCNVISVNYSPKMDRFLKSIKRECDMTDIQKSIKGAANSAASGGAGTLLVQMLRIYNCGAIEKDELDNMWHDVASKKAHIEDTLQQAFVKRDERVTDESE